MPMRVALLALLVANVVTALPARADDPPVNVALFKTAADDASLTDLAAALDPVVSSELSDVAAIAINARPAIDLWSTQLAIDCVGESADCLSAAAKQADAQGLLAPSIAKEGDAVSVSLLYFAAPGAPPRTAKRRYTGEKIGEQALSGVHALVVELFGEPQTATRPRAGTNVPPDGEGEAEAGLQPTAATPAKAKPAGIPVAPVVLGAVGVAFLGTGIGFGLAANATDDEYNKIRVTDRTSANAAVDKEKAAKSQATVANVTIAVGAAAVIGAGILLYWQLSERKSDAQSKQKSNVALTPQVGPRQVGLAVAGAWNEPL